MGLLDIDSLAEGMVLASEVYDRSGRLLLGSGVELSAKHIRMFRSWGIVEVDISGADGQQEQNLPHAEEVDPEQLKIAEEELAPLFCQANLSHPAMAELFRLCLQRKILHETR